MRALCWAFFLLLVLAPNARAGESEIVVVGAGTASIDPDSVKITFAIRVQRETTEQAAAECARVYEQVIAALEGAGFSRKNIYTTFYGVDRRMDEKGRKVVGYSAAQTLYVSTEELDKIGALIDLILGSGVSTIQEISYLSTRADSIRRVALASAVRNAREDAEAMAVAAEGNLGSLIELTTHCPDNPTYRTDTGVQACALRSGIVRSMSITPQPFSVIITVLGRWNLDKSKMGMGDAK